MKYLFSIFLVLSSVNLFSHNSKLIIYTSSPLASYSDKWNDSKYNKCNTAANTAYLNNTEKEIIYIINLIRTNPALFAKTVLKKYPAVSGKGYLADDTYYFQSLINTLSELEPLQLLYPDNKCYTSAKCHAFSSGITGYVGHQRRNKDCKAKKYFNGECCDYGNKDPLEIVLSLLIDEGVSSLGHRDILLSNYSKVGVSVQPHRKYGTNTVLDFYY